ncbi:MAG: phosphotransferase [Pseudomonadota bacterium]
MSDNSTVPAEHVLREKGWLPDGTRVASVESAGAGNMNLVERVRFEDGVSVILKRSRPWVEKYPDIPAPIERASIEAAFYETVSGTSAGRMMPALLNHDGADACSVFADLGAGRDGMGLYAGETLPIEQLDAVARWTADLHAIEVSDEMRVAFRNQAMRALNALHIFQFPLDPDNGFDLDAITPGLQALGDELKADQAFCTAVAEIGELYLRGQGMPDEAVLLHGDLYPGSWLTTEAGLFVIDPEFCWVGPPEWDVGVLSAHLRLSGQPETHVDRLISTYDRPLNRALLDQISGIEMMRRLMGVAQLPLEIGLDEKTALLDEARRLVIGDTL